MLQIFADIFLFTFCFVAAMLLRLESLNFVVYREVWFTVIVSSTLAITALWISGLYRTLVRFLTARVVAAVAIGALVFSLSTYFCSIFLTVAVPRSVPVMTAAFSLLAITGLRFCIREIFRSVMLVARRPVVIYGAGEAGLELLTSLYYGRDYAAVAFIDDDHRLHGLTIGGCLVHSPSVLPELVADFGVQSVLLALPNVSSLRRREILTKLEQFSIEVKTIPSFSDIVSGRARISEVRSISPADLLGRDSVPPNEALLSITLRGRVVMVTGAGGSIGSELCRQILQQKPSVLVLYEMSELALYSIEVELAKLSNSFDHRVKVISVLGSVQDEFRVKAVIEAFGVQTIFHAAAYKHVPIVEENVVEGIKNNVFGTFALANAAFECGVERFILISTDKAVRPTNVMGASKRVAELICQAFAQRGGETIYSMVRFGNVLGSSGSVIPRFLLQIEEGGPVTVTHPEITRYFMTIPEAAQLVIQAGAMAEGGDVFVLDMGDPVKIVDLAITMIKLHGQQPYFISGVEVVEDEPGRVPICFTGLRKGEKLYEELLIGNDPRPTLHPRVMSASEECLPFSELVQQLHKLRRLCDTYDIVELRHLLRQLPLNFVPTEDNPNDVLWVNANDFSSVH